MVLNAFQLYREDQFYRRRKRQYPEKTTDLSQGTDKLDYKMLYQSTSRHERDSNSQLIKGSRKSNVMLNKEIQTVVFVFSEFSQ
jgi:hypothetical protein